MGGQEELGCGGARADGGRKLTRLMGQCHHFIITPTPLSGDYVAMVMAPCNQGGTLIDGVCNVVRETWTVGIAYAFAVPGKADGFCSVVFCGREWWDCAILNLVSDGLCLQRHACLVHANQGFIEVGVFHSGMGTVPQRGFPHARDCCLCCEATD